MNGKVDGLIQAHNAFAVQHATQMQTLSSKIESAHERLDAHLSEHKERKAWLWGVGASAVLALGSVIWEKLKDIFGGKP